MAVSGAKLIGLDKVLTNLNKQARAIPYRTERNLVRAGLFIKGESQIRTPVDTGHLRASAYSRKVGGFGGTTVVEIGYSAAYAPFVHENLEARHGSRRPADYKGASGKVIGPGAPEHQAKFLENAIRVNLDRILRIIAGGG